MIPYFQFISFRLGPLTFYVWGLMVALGLLAGTWTAARLAKERGLDPKRVWDAAALAALVGIVCGRLFHIIAYQPAWYLAHPLDVFALWNGGMSITGSMLGAVGTLAWVFVFARGNHGGLPLRENAREAVAYLDVIAFGVPLAYGIGRIGCFLIHDHPGTLTHFVLGVRYPDGLVRHDLGLYEALNGFGLFLVFLVLHHRKAKPPTYAIAFLFWYGIVRFFLDFLRANDARYLGLTPAQYVAAVMVVGGIVWVYRAQKTHRANHV